jgi:hypothetical protein
LSEISRVSRVVVSTPEGITREWPGRSSTSSKVNASVNVMGDVAIGANSFAAAMRARQPRDGNSTARAVRGWRVLIALFKPKANDRRPGPAERLAAKICYSFQKATIATREIDAPTSP